MAAANLNTNKVALGDNALTAVTLTALDGTDGGEYTVANPSSETLFIVVNADTSNAETVTLKKPASPCMGEGTAFPDKAVSVAAGKTAVLRVESMRYMGKDGKIKLTGSADVKVAVIEM